MKQGNIDPKLKAHIDNIQKAIDNYTSCLVMPCFDDDVEFFKERIAVLLAWKAELVGRI